MTSRGLLDDGPHRQGSRDFNEIRPFTLPIGEWFTQPPPRGQPFVVRTFLLNESGQRLHAFAHRVAYDWPDDPDQPAQHRLLRELADGAGDAPVKGSTDDLWRCLFAAVRGDRFADGTIGKHAVALVRIGNELRRRMIDEAREGLFPRWLVRQNADDSVEAFSAQRLPFDSSSWAKRFRAKLRGTLQELKGSPADILSGTYLAARETGGVADTENVVFYNVGLGAFTGRTSVGLRFERSYEQGSEDPHAVFPLVHALRYEMIRHDADFRHVKLGVSLLRWNDVLLPRVSPSLKPAAVWWALREAGFPATATGVHAGAFAVRLRVHGARGAPLGGLMKPLLDGVIAACHCWSSGSTEEVGVLASRLADQLGVTADDVRARLVEGPVAMLGARDFVRRHGPSVAWNPEDERCLAGEVLAGRADGEPAMSGEVFALESPDRPR